MHMRTKTLVDPDLPIWAGLELEDIQFTYGKAWHTWDSSCLQANVEGT